jgi:hypothetical protein
MKKVDLVIEVHLQTCNYQNKLEAHWASILGEGGGEVIILSPTILDTIEICPPKNFAFLKKQILYMRCTTRGVAYTQCLVR